MMTVPAAVICGVTCSISTASLKVTVTVLLATVWIGIWIPCCTFAGMLFCVVSRGVDRTRPLPVRSSARERDVEVEGAVDRAERQADRGVHRADAEVLRRQADDRAGLLGAGRARVSSGRTLRAEPAAERAAVRERQAGGVADLRRHAAVETPLDADRLGEVAGGLDDARFDFDLRLGAIERA